MQFFIYTYILCWFVFTERKQGNLGQEMLKPEDMESSTLLVLAYGGK